MTKVNSGGYIQKIVAMILAIFVAFSICNLSAFADDTDTDITSTDKMISFKLSLNADITAFDEYIGATDSSGADAAKYKIKATSNRNVTTSGGIGDQAINDIISLEGSEGLGKYQFNNSLFNDLESKSQQQFITDLMRELKGSKYSSTATQEISDALSSADSNMANMLIPFVFDDMGADMATAYKWLAPFLNVVRIILGVLAIVVLLALILSTVVDCCYMGLPVARETMQKGKDGNVDQNKKPAFISYDAFKTINETESQMGDGGTYKNPFAVYFKRRAVTYIILALCLFYLVAGEMSGLISWLLSLVSGITG